MDKYIDEFALARKYKTNEHELYQKLVALVAQGKLKTQVLWVCCGTGEVSSTQNHVKDFPQVLQCSKCGFSHSFHVDYIQVAILDHPDLDEMIKNFVETP